MEALRDRDDPHRRRRRQRARLDAEPAADRQARHPDAPPRRFPRRARTASSRCASWSPTEQMDLRIGQVTGLKGEGGRLEAAICRGTDGAAYEIACDAMLPFFGLTMKLGPIADWGLNLHENLIPVDTEKFETSHPGHLRGRRHQHLSRQAEAHPVRLPRGRPRRPEGSSLRLSREEAALPVHDVVDQPAEEAGSGVTGGRLLGSSRPLAGTSISSTISPSCLNSTQCSPALRTTGG